MISHRYSVAANIISPLSHINPTSNHSSFLLFPAIHQNQKDNDNALYNLTACIRDAYNG